MLKTRIITAVIGIPVLLAFLYQGRYFQWFFFLLLGVLAVKEMLAMLPGRNYSPLLAAPYMLVAVLSFSPLLEKYLLPALLLVVLLTVVETVFLYPRLTVLDLAASMWGPAYVGFLLSFAVRIAQGEQVFLIILLIFCITWSSDSGGYFIGRWFGKHKMAPALSPNKTWQGAGGAIIFSIITCYMFFYISKIMPFSLEFILLLGITGSIMAQIGDLFMSALKRTYGIKDFSNIIPGHGGILDRFDSFFLVLPAGYYVSLLLAGKLFL